MGIGSSIAELCAIEHRRRPLGRVLLFGRQTMFFSPEYAIHILRTHGVTPTETDPARIDVDTYTLAGKDRGTISDGAFFRLMGVTDINYMDVSAYEGADIIHNLNNPIPAELEGTVDFILDGSTLDNVWNPCNGIMNMARLLRPGGRIVSVNMGSNHNTPHLIMTPTWVLDYFVANNFADCLVGVTAMRDDGSFNVFSLDLDRLSRKTPALNFTCPYQMGIQFVAEKGRDSTWDRTVTQEFYRTDREWDAYEPVIERYRKSPRRGMWSSGVPLFVDPVPAGYRHNGPPAEPTDYLRVRSRFEAGASS